jgi:hypothetical protein
VAVVYQVSVEKTEIIDGNREEGCLLSEVWWVLYCRGRSKGSWGIMVEFDFWSYARSESPRSSSIHGVML